MESVCQVLRSGAHISNDDVAFQLLHVEVLTPVEPLGRCDARDLCSDYHYGNEPNTDEFKSFNDLVSHVYVFGVTRSGASVLVQIHDFHPFFYVELSNGVVAHHVTFMLERSGLVRHSVVERKKMYGWCPDESDVTKTRKFKFLRLEFASVIHMRVAAKKLMNETSFNVCELNVGVTEKFLSLHDVRPCDWVRLKKATAVDATQRVSVSSLEVKCNVYDMYRDDAAPTCIAPLIIASVDIEAHSGDLHSFPNAQLPGDVVSVISTTFWVFGDTVPRLQVTQLLGDVDTSHATSTHVLIGYQSERELLCAWRDLIAVYANPDLVVSYNGSGFDFKYMNDRWKMQPRHAGGRFERLSRLLMQHTPLQEREMTSAAFGQNFLYTFPMPGRIQLDLYMYMKNNHKLDSYKLDFVCDTYLNDRKKVVLDSSAMATRMVDELFQQIITQTGEGEHTDAYRQTANDIKRSIAEREFQVAKQRISQWIADMNAATNSANEFEFHTWFRPLADLLGDNNYVRLFRMYTGSPTDRAAIADYCAVDAELVVLLIERLNVVSNVTQMSHVCTTLPNDVCNRGQQIKTYNLISRYALQRGYIMNTRSTGWNSEYEGATVLEPRAGFYTLPVITFDFASLYPSIMCARNLCPSSLVLDQQYLNLPGVTYEERTTGTQTWTFQTSVRGILPDILTSLLQARKDKKNEMKQYAKSSFEYRLCDSAQLALKVSANSVYGFCGFVNGHYSCLPVAALTTLYGREAIATTAQFMRSRYGATVVYGDTDSVMVTVPNIGCIQDAFAWAPTAAQQATELFPKPMKLEFEKVSCPFLSIGKKTYAAMKYEDVNTPGVVDVKGLAVVRRDTCAYIRTVLARVLDLVLRVNDLHAAYTYINEAVWKLARHQVDVDQFVTSSSYKAPESYVNKQQPQLTVVAKMEQRKAFDVPRIGDRVPYVVLAGSATKVSERAEDPVYARTHNLRLDMQYYLESLRTRLCVITDVLNYADLNVLFAEAERSANSVTQGKLAQWAVPKPNADALVVKPFAQPARKRTVLTFQHVPANKSVQPKVKKNKLKPIPLTSS